MRKEKILSENMENWKHEKGIGRGKKTIVEKMKSGKFGKTLENSKVNDVGKIYHGEGETRRLGSEKRKIK